MTVQVNQNVKVNYVGTLNDGSEFDNSYKRGQTLDFTAGVGQMIKGFDDAIIGMQVGEKKTIKIMPEDAYGHVNEQALIEVPKDNFEQGMQLNPGDTVEGRSEDGQIVIVKVASVNENTVTLDTNHPLAGQELNFEIELMEIF